MSMASSRWAGISRFVHRAPGQGGWLKFAGFALSRLAKFFGLGEDRAAYDPKIENRHIEGPL
jgi:hypothetical protein